MALFDLKLPGIPEHTVAAYVIPLDEPDLRLGRGWLGKYKALEDWDHESLEITMNGRRYQLNPPMKTPALRVMDDDKELKELKEQLRWVEDMEKEERTRRRDMEGAFEEDIDYILATYKGEVTTRIEMKERMKEKKENTLKEFEELAELDDKEEPKLCKRGKELHGRNKRRYFRNLTLRWLKQSCKDLTRPVGTPAKLLLFTIDTVNHALIKIPPRKYSPADLAKIKEFLDENTANGIIKSSESPWSSPIVVVTKQDGSPRICVDYRALNAITIKDAHPIPNIDKCFPHLGNAKYFTSLDLKSGYWQIPLDKEAKLRAAFSTRYGHFQWNVLPFGLTNAPGSFQRRINQILALFLDKFVISYTDDILVYSGTIKEHYEHVKKVLLALQEARMILHIGKCEFFVSEVKFLGHIVSADGIRPDPGNIAKVIE